MRGKRGQAFFREALAALDAMPDKRLIAEALEVPPTGMPFRLNEGGVCLLGAVGRERAIDMRRLDPEDAEGIAASFDIAEVLAREVAWVNDEAGYYKETPEERFERVRAWVKRQIREEPTP